MGDIPIILMIGGVKQGSFESVKDLQPLCIQYIPGLTPADISRKCRDHFGSSGPWNPVFYRRYHPEKPPLSVELSHILEACAEQKHHSMIVVDADLGHQELHLMVLLGPSMTGAPVPGFAAVSTQPPSSAVAGSSKRGRTKARIPQVNVSDSSPDCDSCEADGKGRLSSLSLLNDAFDVIGKVLPIKALQSGQVYSAAPGAKQVALRWEQESHGVQSSMPVLLRCGVSEGKSDIQKQLLSIADELAIKAGDAAMRDVPFFRQYGFSKQEVLAAFHR